MAGLAADISAHSYEANNCGNCRKLDMTRFKKKVGDSPEYYLQIYCISCFIKGAVSGMELKS